MSLYFRYFKVKKKKNGVRTTTSFLLFFSKEEYILTTYRLHFDLTARIPSTL